MSAGSHLNFGSLLLLIGLFVGLSTTLLGCSEDSPPPSKLSIRVATAPTAQGCTAGTGMAEITCLRVRVCEAGYFANPSGKTCSEIAPGEMHSDATNLLFLLAGSGTFDAKTKASRVDIEVVGYAGGVDGGPSARYVGRSRNVSLASNPEVWLYPIGEVACASGAQPARRAFHQTVALPSGEVLLLGGVTGETTFGSVMGVPFQDKVEVYRPETAEFVELDGELPRVFFSAFYVGESAGVHRVRLVGGYGKATKDVAAVFRVDNDDNVHSPINPGADTQPALIQDLLYDVDGASVSVVPLEGNVPAEAVGWASRVVEKGTQKVVALGYPTINSGSCRNGRSVLTSGCSGSLVRFGDAIERVAIESRVAPSVAAFDDAELVWGGLITDDPDNFTNHVGEEVSGSMVTFVGFSYPDEDNQSPTSFHGAAQLIEGQLLLVGGNRNGVTDDVVSTLLHPWGLRVLERRGPALVGVTEVGIPDFEPTLFHGQLLLTGDDGTRRLLVAGGVSSEDKEGTFPRTLDPSASITLIEYVDGAAIPADSYRAVADGPQTLTVPRFGHSLAPLPDGRVLVTGGYTGTGGASLLPVSTAEVLSFVDSVEGAIPTDLQCEGGGG